MVSKKYTSFLSSRVEVFHDIFIYMTEGECFFYATVLNWIFENNNSKIKHCFSLHNYINS